MLHSMTGFGSASGQVGAVQYAVEMRSVNNRYLKISTKLPESCQGAEGQIERLIRDRVERGTVTCSIRMKVAEEAAVYHVNQVALESYLQQLRELQAEADPSARIDLAGLLQLPGVCEPPQLEEVVRESLPELLEIVGQALEALLEMRRQEGQSLTSHLMDQCDEIAARLDVVARRAPDVVQEYHQRLTQRVQELVDQGRVNIDEESLAREVAIYAERSDIAEEVSRLTAHLQQFRDSSQGDGAVGRKLDFIAQEMLREANTIASKSNDAEIARAVVEIKTAVDRIKEQVQNAE
jgi:uncharacterized protein (TIGR00255 family)